MASETYLLKCKTCGWTAPQKTLQYPFKQADLSAYVQNVVDHRQKFEHFDFDLSIVAS